MNWINDNRDLIIAVAYRATLEENPGRDFIKDGLALDEERMEELSGYLGEYQDD